MVFVWRFAVGLLLLVSVIVYSLLPSWSSKFSTLAVGVFEFYYLLAVDVVDIVPSSYYLLLHHCIGVLMMMMMMMFFNP